MDCDLLVRGRLFTCDGPGVGIEALGQIKDGAVVVHGGAIAWVGSFSELPDITPTQTLATESGFIMPGLVDPHTHLAFAGSRVPEFCARMAGADYRDIAEAGGGIKSTVRATRQASDDALYARMRGRAWAMRRRGVTSVEVKSGYGLSTEEELRHLRLARKLGEDGIVNVTTSLLGAHALPPEWDAGRQAYVDLVCAEMIPRAAEEGLADACDVYLDDGAFSRREAKSILSAAISAGLKVRAHVGQFEDLQGAELLAELGGLSADHLEAVSEAGLQAMAQASVRAVLLPGAWTTLRQKAPEAQRMRSAGVSMAIGTDCNPGTSPTVDLTLCAALAVRSAGLTLEEAILGITREAAMAAGFKDAGRIAVGMRADLVHFLEDDPRSLAYSLGGPDAVWTLLAGIRTEPLPQDVPLW